jgi:hypothetical protein
MLCGYACFTSSPKFAYGKLHIAKYIVFNVLWCKAINAGKPAERNKMSACQQLDNTDPRIIAWERHKKTETYANTVRWIEKGHYTGELWRTFVEGYESAFLYAEIKSFSEWFYRFAHWFFWKKICIRPDYPLFGKLIGEQRGLSLTNWWYRKTGRLAGFFHKKFCTRCKEKGNTTKH